MKTTSVISFYSPYQTWLHRLHPGVKLVLFMAYAVAIFSVNTLLGQACILAILTLALMQIRLEPSKLSSAVFCFFLLILPAILPALTSLSSLAISIGKIASIFTLVSLFTLTTRPALMLQYLLKPRQAWLTYLQPGLYMFNTMLAVYPSLEYDLQRAIDAEKIRLGQTRVLLNLGSWMTILIVVLARTLTRAERFSDSVLDRGFSTEQVITVLQERSVSAKDWLLLGLGCIPMAIFWILSR